MRKDEALLIFKIKIKTGLGEPFLRKMVDDENEGFPCQFIETDGGENNDFELE